jgi:hypothetical protein
MAKIKFFAKFVGIITVITFFSGCSLTYTIKDPVLSSIDYGKVDTKPVTLTIVDQRTGIDSIFVVGRFGLAADLSKAPVSLENMEDPVGYFAGHLEKEFISRKVPVKCAVGKIVDEGLTLEINKYQIINRRATAFSPWEAMHIFYGTITKNGGKTPVRTYFYNGKTPVWSANEIKEPCFDIPVSIIIKDVASKINKVVFNYSAPDEMIDRITSEISAEFGKDENGPFWKILELGYTNNPKAMEPLKKYAQQGYEFFKSCALSAIGTLGADGQLEFLKQRYGAGGYNDRYMAVKAIGDIGTPEALQFIQTLKKDGAYEKEAGLKYCVDLYTP